MSVERAFARAFGDDAPVAIGSGWVSLGDDHAPDGVLAQLAWPFRHNEEDR